MFALRSRSIATALAIVLLLAILQFWGYSNVPVAQAATSIHQETQSPQCSPCYSFYGSVSSWMSTATSDWWEQQSNWCGVANIRAIQRYDWMYWGKHGGSTTTPEWDNSQSAIFSRLRSSGQSPWGRGSGGDNLVSNISGDFGTDPHSIAYGAWYETPVSTSNQPYWFHNWIYRTSATVATYDFATDFGTKTVSHNDPISITIDGGYHSFVVSGVYASSDPSLGNESISSVVTWDPWLNSSNQARDGHYYYNTTQEEVWSLSNWTSLAKFWGQGYNTHNGSDPDPDTPNHYYVPPFPGGYTGHWNTYFVTIEQDDISNASTSYNYAIDQNGHLAPHN